MSKKSYPQMTYEQVVEHCRQYADIIRADGIDLFLSDIGESAVISDMLGYPLEMQEWINEKQYPLLSEIIEAAADVDRYHAKRESWKRLLDLIDKL